MSPVKRNKKITREFRGFWTIIHSWKLEILPLQVTSYNAPFIQFSPELSAH